MYAYWLTAKLNPTPLVPTTSPTRLPFCVFSTMNARSLVMPSPPVAQPAERQFHQPCGALPPL
jgi:hypothetical protein